MFSIIIPVYNVEQYLDKCLKSISKQTFLDFECIIVDDGSPDNSNAIIDKYVNKDQRFKVIHQKNMGLSAARNTGLDVAKGDYITFVDSDDYIANDYLEKFVLKIASSNADIIICGIIEVFKNYENSRVFANATTEVIKQNILADTWPSFVCNKCYKKELFDNVRFPVGKAFEDLLTIPEVCLNANKIVCIPDKLYYYNRQNVSSITAKMSLEKMYNLFEGHSKSRKLAILHNINCVILLDEKMVKEAIKCLLINCYDNKLSEIHEQIMLDYLKERLDKSEIVGIRDRLWVKMLLAKRKKLCAWYAHIRGK